MPCWRQVLPRIVHTAHMLADWHQLIEITDFDVTYQCFRGTCNTLIVIYRYLGIMCTCISQNALILQSSTARLFYNPQLLKVPTLFGGFPTKIFNVFSDGAFNLHRDVAALCNDNAIN